MTKNPFKVGDRVKIYLVNGHIKGTVENVNDRFIYIPTSDEAYPYQWCRKLVKKEKEYFWINRLIFTQCAFNEINYKNLNHNEKHDVIKFMVVDE